MRNRGRTAIPENYALGRNVMDIAFLVPIVVMAELDFINMACPSLLEAHVRILGPNRDIHVVRNTQAYSITIRGGITSRSIIHVCSFQRLAFPCLSWMSSTA